MSFHHLTSGFQQTNSFMTEAVTSGGPTQSWGFVKTKPKYLDLFGLKIPIGKMPGLESGSGGLVCLLPTFLESCRKELYIKSHRVHPVIVYSQINRQSRATKEIVTYLERPKLTSSILIKFVIPKFIVYPSVSVCVHKLCMLWMCFLKWFFSPEY